jgi:hypothetical protein
MRRRHDDASDGDRSPAVPTAGGTALAQLRILARIVARRSAGPALTLLVVGVAMVVAANAPATLLVMLPGAVWYRRRRRQRQ